MTASVNMFLLPPKAHLCQVCGTKHEDHYPHNRDSFYYQTAFNMEHGRAPAWRDAMVHCSDDMKAVWVNGLVERGVSIDG